MRQHTKSSLDNRLKIMQNVIFKHNRSNKEVEMWSKFFIRYAALSVVALHNCTASIVHPFSPLQAEIFRITEQLAFH
jgi:hypothetical protein